MAFDRAGFKIITHLGAIGVGKGSTKKLCHYVSTEDPAAIETAGFFNALKDDMNVGDQIDCILGIGTALKVRAYGVTAVSPNVVISVGT
jgi:hypothetical protein